MEAKLNDSSWQEDSWDTRRSRASQGDAAASVLAPAAVDQKKKKGLEPKGATDAGHDAGIVNQGTE